MRTIYLDTYYPDDDLVEEVAQAFLTGQLVAYPTDTIYGLGCLAADTGAVDRVYEAKGRSRSKPLVVLMSDLDIVGTYCRIDSAQKEYLRSLWPWVSGRQDGRARPSTVILEADKDLPAAGDDGSLAVRVPQSLSCYSQLGEKGLGGQADGLPKLDFLIKLLKRVNTPIVATSLNISGKKPIARISSGHTSLGMAGIDLILAAGYARKKKPSQLIDVRDINNIRILRK